MRSDAGVVLLVASLVALPFALACKPSSRTPEDSSTAIGTFSVEATLEENGCRPGLEAADSLAYSVELRRDSTTLVWRRNAGAPVGGTLRSDGTFRLRTRDLRQAWPADPANGIVGCTLEEINTVSGALVEGGDGGVSADAGVADGGVSSRVTSFRADHEIEVAPAAGSDCSLLLIANGGSFPTFPCAALYRLEAERD